MDNRPVRILVDTNVALDLLLNREPFAIDALQLFALAEAEKVELLLSTDAISTIFYVVRKNCDSSVAREALSRWLLLTNGRLSGVLLRISRMWRMRS